MASITDRARQWPQRVSGWVLLYPILAWTVPVHAQAPATADLDRAEQLSWMDAPSALQLLDKLQATARDGNELVHWLMARGMAYVEVDPKQVQPIVRQLQELGRTQLSAAAAGHIVQGYSDRHSGQFAAAEAQLNQIGTATALPAFARFRVAVLRGLVAQLSNQQERAVASYEQALDLANDMHSLVRTFEVMYELSVLYGSTGNLERAATLVTSMRAIAQQTGDDLQWVDVLNLEDNIAQDRGDHAAQQRALLESLQHARRTGSDRSLAIVLEHLGEFYSKSGDYAVALDYSTEALAAARRTRRPGLEQLATFYMGLAEIGLGHLVPGKRLAEGAIQDILATRNLSDADLMMRDYVTILEKVGDLREALDVAHRENELHERVINTARQKAILELSAKFDAERRARRIELLQRDNTIKNHDLQAQRLRQQMIILAAALIVLACAALAWGIARIRTINARWVRNSQRDALTGLLNRRYFSEHDLTQRSHHPYVGCLLLINVDQLQYINTLFGHAAGDAVLATLGRRLADILRDSESLVRWAGEEFLAVLSPMSAAQLNQLVRRLLTAVHRDAVSWNGRDHQCTLSIGYASFPMDGVTVSVSLDRAITLVGNALLQAKRQGRNRACFINRVNANSEQELSTISVRFEEAATDRRVQLVETVGAST